ncbi:MULTISPECIES: hypothetical protein [Arenibacter]|uniref:hypothetical protein n=1 Tax=Arenibacter TaxID=178469 RepID=UPI0012FFEEB9|nr:MULTISPECIES: hypothetical protein [Arenibacter]
MQLNIATNTSYIVYLTHLNLGFPKPILDSFGNFQELNTDVFGATHPEIDPSMQLTYKQLPDTLF